MELINKYKTLQEICSSQLKFVSVPVTICSKPRYNLQIIVTKENTVISQIFINIKMNV